MNIVVLETNKYFEHRGDEQPYSKSINDLILLKYFFFSFAFRLC